MLIALLLIGLLGAVTSAVTTGLMGFGVLAIFGAYVLGGIAGMAFALCTALPPSDPPRRDALRAAPRGVPRFG